MDLTLLDKATIRVKGKKASLIIDPGEKSPKQPADCVVLLNKDGALDRVENFRLVVNNDGEYEVGGIKITGNSVDDSGILYGLNVDGSQVILAKTSTIEKMSDIGNEAEIAVLNVDSLLNEGIVASLEAKAVVLYGEKAAEGLKALGKQDLSPVRKVTLGKEKLPQEVETQIVWLG